MKTSTGGFHVQKLIRRAKKSKNLIATSIDITEEFSLLFSKSKPNL